MSFRPTVLVAEPNRELRWLGQLWWPGLFDGEHSFSIEPLGEGRVRFVQRERFGGFLVPFLSKMLDGHTRRGFEEMNGALKLRAESASGSSGDATEQSMKDDLPIRRTYQDSCELLQQLGFLEIGTIPPIPDHQPQYDDEEPLGVNFFLARSWEKATWRV